jgi:hypothetical protein
VSARAVTAAAAATVAAAAAIASNVRSGALALWLSCFLHAPRLSGRRRAASIQPPYAFIEPPYAFIKPPYRPA